MQGHGRTYLKTCVSLFPSWAPVLFLLLVVPLCVGQEPAGGAPAPQAQVGSAAPPQPSAASDASDASVLQEFAKHFSNFNRALDTHKLGAWTRGVSICKWGGVTCLPDTERVSEIRLGNLGLQGACCSLAVHRQARVLPVAS